MSENFNPRPSDIEVESRIYQCYVWLLRCYPRHWIVKEGSRLWGVENRNVDEYLKRAKQLIQDEYTADKENELEHYFKQMDDLYNSCMIAGDRKTASSILKMRGDLRGYFVDKQEIKQTIITVKLDEE